MDARRKTLAIDALKKAQIDVRGKLRECEGDDLHGEIDEPRAETLRDLLESSTRLIDALNESRTGRHVTLGNFCRWLALRGEAWQVDVVLELDFDVDIFRGGDQNAYRYHYMTRVGPTDQRKEVHRLFYDHLRVLRPNFRLPMGAIVRDIIEVIAANRGNSFADGWIDFLIQLEGTHNYTFDVVHLLPLIGSNLRMLRILNRLDRQGRVDPNDYFVSMEILGGMMILRDHLEAGLCLLTNCVDERSKRNVVYLEGNPVGDNIYELSKADPSFLICLALKLLMIPVEHLIVTRLTSWTRWHDYYRSLIGTAASTSVRRIGSCRGCLNVLYEMLRFERFFWGSRSAVLQFARRVFDKAAPPDRSDLTIDDLICSWQIVRGFRAARNARDDRTQRVSEFLLPDTLIHLICGKINPSHLSIASVGHAQLQDFLLSLLELMIRKGYNGDEPECEDERTIIEVLIQRGAFRPSGEQERSDLHRYVELNRRHPIAERVFKLCEVSSLSSESVE